MSLQSTKKSFLGLLLLFFFGFSITGQAQDPSVIYVSPDPNSIYTTVTTYCVNGTLGVGFSDYLNAGMCDATLNPNIYNADNRYVVQLSDASGSFASPTIIVTSPYFTPLCRRVASGALSGPIPATVVAGTGYRVRVATTSPVTYGATFGTALTILAAPVQPDFGPSATVAQNGAITLANTAACSGTLVWGRTNGDMAIGTGTIAVPTTQLGVVSYSAICRTTACGNSPVGTVNITVVGPTPPPPPAPTPFAVVLGVLSCATPTAAIDVIGGDQFSFTGPNGTQDGIVGVFDGSFRDNIGEGYRLVRTPIPTNGRAVVNKPGTYTVTARNGNSAPTQVQVVVTGVACL